jgi:hypothetical protein
MYTIYVPSHSLRDIRMHYTGDNLDKGIVAIRKSISQRTQGALLLRKITEEKMRMIVKSLMQIGASLSQSREYRDFLEDILSKISEPLHEFGLNVNQIQIFLIQCSCLLNVMPLVRGSTTTQTLSAGNIAVHTARKKDWIRFLLCTRLLTVQLLAS